MKTTVKVNNIQCEACADRIKKVLSQHDDIIAVHVDVTTGDVSTEGNMDRHALVDALDSLGHSQITANNNE